MDIEGKVAIVTGAASGIGRATALALADRGAGAITIVDIDKAGLDSLGTALAAKGAKALPLVLDLAETAGVEAMHRETDAAFGGADILFNNAGIVGGPPPFPDTDLERIRLLVALDLVAVIQSTALGIRSMAQRGGGVIINTASTAAVTPLPSDAAYAGAKAGVGHFSVSCGAFATSHKVRVVAVGPGVTETPILEKTGGGKRPDWLVPLLANLHFLTPQDIAAKVIEVIEDDSIAGELILVHNSLREAAQ